MNKVDELLIKYNFTKEPIKDDCINEESSNLDEKINKRYLEIEDIINTQAEKELVVINEIQDLMQNRTRIIKRLNLVEVASDEYEVGKSYKKLLKLKKNIEKKIEEEQEKDKKVLSQIENEIDEKEFEQIKHNFNSSKFLQYISEKVR